MSIDIRGSYWKYRAWVRARLYDLAFGVVNSTVWLCHFPDFFSFKYRRGPEISARSTCCLEVASNDVLLQKNQHFRHAPASIVKLATALFLIRSGQSLKDEFVSIEAGDIAEPIGSNMKLRKGDIVSYLDLVYGMLLASGNDAARAAARVIGLQMLQDEGRHGDATVRFVAAMNELANSLGMKNTRFCNPTGQDSFGQYSTAFDLAKLASAAFSNPVILEVISERQHVARIRGENARDETLYSTLDDEGIGHVVGGKTGTSRNARACLALFLEKSESRHIVIVILGSDPGPVTDWPQRNSSFHRYEDMQIMVDHVMNVIK